jgi:hypothetical protein
MELIELGEDKGLNLEVENPTELFYRYFRLEIGGSNIRYTVVSISLFN